MGKTISSALLEHIKRYPKMQIEDCLKLIYQSTFGGEHLVLDENKCFDYIYKEYDEIAKTKSIYIEELANGVSRVYLNGLEKDNLDIFSKLFILGSKNVKGSEEKLLENIKELEFICKEKKTSFSYKELEDFLDSYKKDIKPIHHSKIYNENYCPAYRVMPSLFANLLPFIFEINEKLKENKKVVVAIDGKCGSGKTTIADIISNLYNINVIRMDDFFVPPDLRNMEHKELPVHYERFIEEVLRPLKENKDIEYTIFDCSTLTYTDKIKVKNNGLVLIEGSYCLGNKFDKYYDIGAYVSCKKEEQLDRLKKRCNDEKYFNSFLNEWIPSEEEYCKRENTLNKVDYKIET